MVALTIGMATYNDFDGVYFTLQALRWFHDLTDTELLVVDNYGCEHTRQFVEGWTKTRYVQATDVVGTAAPRNLIFQEAQGEAVLCCDSHVLFAPGAIAKLKAYYTAHPDCRDLLQGPMLADDLQMTLTHLEPVWHDEMWGIWATDSRGLDPAGAPFDIPMQGLGVFSCRKEAWPGFHPAFRGFGGEEGYLHEKVRQRGGRTLCLPWLRWGHRFGRPAGVPYPVLLHDKVKNYVIGHTELGLDLAPVEEHFSSRLSAEAFRGLQTEALAEKAAAETLSHEAQLSEGVVMAMTSQETKAGQPIASRRAIVCFVEDTPHLIQQLHALRLSWLYADSPDTDLVVFGPEDLLAHLPEDLVKIPQQPASDDPVWRGYRYINALACLNGQGAERLNAYSHLLRTDLDTFITPAWNQFYPKEFTFGTGSYDHNEVRQRVLAIADEYELQYRGMTDVGSTWYGPTALVRRTGAIAELLTKHILTEYFADHEGQWPGWFRGVALRYAGEIAVNHCAPAAMRSALLDASSTSREPIDQYPHIHCWHTDEKFSKHWFMAGLYTREDARDLDLGIVSDYCMTLSFGSLAIVQEHHPLVRSKP